MREGFDLCGFFFFILSRAVNSRGLAAFRDGFRKGLGLNFFLQLRSIGRKRGKDLVNGVRGF